MANIKAGIMGAIATVVILIVELLLFPVALSFMGGLNSTRNCASGVTSELNCTGDWITASDRTILSSAPTLIVVIVLFTVLGGMIGSVLVAVKG